MMGKLLVCYLRNDLDSSLVVVLVGVVFSVFVYVSWSLVQREQPGHQRMSEILVETVLVVVGFASGDEFALNVLQARKLQLCLF